MASNYPTSLDSLSTNRQNGQTILAETDNDQADAINKIEGELGTDPSGAYSTVKARLDAQMQVVTQGTITVNTNLSMTGRENALWIVTLGANNLKVSITGWSAGSTVTLVLKQDGTGRTGTQLPTSKWEGAVVPVVTTTANAIDIYTFFYDGTNQYGFTGGQGFA